MIKVYLAKQSREADAHMINELEIPSAVLMENAAFSVCESVRSRVQNGKVLILVGAGNNGGDGLAVLRRLHIMGIDAVAVMLADEKLLMGDARLNYEIAKKAALRLVDFENAEGFLETVSYAEFSVIVDAIFGTGLKRDVCGIAAKAIEAANTADVYRIAVDIPSGIECDTGRLCGIAFSAHETVTFQACKPAHVLFPGREYSGQIRLCNIGITLPDYVEEGECSRILCDDDVMRLLPPRTADSYKGTYGRALLIAGSASFCGAAVMAATATLRVGAGLLVVLCGKSVSRAINARLPEAMIRRTEGLSDVKLMESEIRKARAIAIGSGLGNVNGIELALELVLNSKKPCVIDADALTVLANSKKLRGLLHKDVVLTPHVGEFARLSGMSIEEIKKNPMEAASGFAKEYGCNVILKGSTSVICTNGGKQFYNLKGNAGLAKGGSGDVLAGLALGLLTQGTKSSVTAAIAPYILGMGAEKAANALDLRAILPSEVAETFELIQQNNDF